MSFMERFRGIREEATLRIFGTLAKKNAPPTYVNDFILGQKWFREEPENQGAIVRMNPYAWAVTQGLANSVFEDGFRFVSPDDPEMEILQDRLKELKRMEALKWFAMALGGERTYGHCWLFVGEEELSTDTTIERARVANLDVFTPEFASVVKWDDNGAPEQLELKILTAKGHEAQQYQTKNVSVSECILVRTRPFDRSHEGLPITGPIWNSLVSTALIDHAITTYSMKMGLGALIMKTKGAVSTEDAAAAKSMMEDLSVSKVGVVPGRAVDTLEYVGASGSTVDFGSFTDIFLNEIAGGTRIPVSIIIGAADVAAGVEVGPTQYGMLKQGEQTRFEPVIREVMRRMGVEEEYEINWPVKVAVDQKAEAEIRALTAQADLMESQAEQSKAMAQEGRGPNDVQLSVKDQDKNQNPAGSQ